jgi:hypothetical protein
MENLRFVSSVVNDFFREPALRKKLIMIRDKELSGWEKWLQIELAIYLDNHKSVMQSGREEKFEIDHRKSDRSHAYVDFVFRKKNASKDFLVAVELKQYNSFKTCLSKMLDDAGKLYKIKQQQSLRECFLLGIHDKEDPQKVIDVVWDKYEPRLPSKKRIVSAPIGQTGYSFTLF